MDNLIEEMAGSVTNWHITSSEQVAREMLSVVRKNIHLAAEVCPDCHGAGWYAQQVSDDEQEERQCERCVGHGIVAKGE